MGCIYVGLLVVKSTTAIRVFWSTGIATNGWPLLSGGVQLARVAVIKTLAVGGSFIAK